MVIQPKKAPVKIFSDNKIEIVRGGSSDRLMKETDGNSLMAIVKNKR